MKTENKQGNIQETLPDLPRGADISFISLVSAHSAGTESKMEIHTLSFSGVKRMEQSYVPWPLGFFSGPIHLILLGSLCVDKIVCIIAQSLAHNEWPLPWRC
jgi:hypothetical protein